MATTDESMERLFKIRNANTTHLDPQQADEIIRVLYILQAAVQREMELAHIKRALDEAKERWHYYGPFGP